MEALGILIIEDLINIASILWSLLYIVNIAQGIYLQLFIQKVWTKMK